MTRLIIFGKERRKALLNPEEIVSIVATDTPFGPASYITMRCSQGCLVDEDIDSIEKRLMDLARAEEEKP